MPNRLPDLSTHMSQMQPGKIPCSAVGDPQHCGSKNVREGGKHPFPIHPMEILEVELGSSPPVNPQLLAPLRYSYLINGNQVSTTLTQREGIKPVKWECRVGCHSLLQGIFSTQGLNLCLLYLLHCQTGSLPTAPPEKPNKRESVANGHAQQMGESGLPTVKTSVFMKYHSFKRDKIPSWLLAHEVTVPYQEKIGGNKGHVR